MDFCNIFFFQGYVFIFEIRNVSIEIHWLVRSFGGLHLDFPGMTSLPDRVNGGSEFLRSRAIQCIFKEDGDMETFFLDSVWTMFWYINLPYIKQLDLVMFIQFSLKFPLFILFVVQETLMRHGWYGSGFNRGFDRQVICKDFCTAGCTQIGCLESIKVDFFNNTARVS